MDLFDPKPALTKHQGQPFPGKLEVHFDKQANKLPALTASGFDNTGSQGWCSASSSRISPRSSTI